MTTRRSDRTSARFAHVRRRNDERATCRAWREMPRDRQHAAHAADRAVEPQLAEEREPVNGLGG